MYCKLKVIKRSDSRAGEALEFCEKNLLSNNFSLHLVFSKRTFLRKLFDIGFSYKHCNFTPTCLPDKMASKTVIRPIIFYFPSQKQRNYRWVEKTFGLLSARAIKFAPRIFCFWRITIKTRRRWESQISNSLTRQNNNLARASRFFVHFFAVNWKTTRENT